MQLTSGDHSTFEHVRMSDSTIETRKPNQEQKIIEGLARFSIQSEYSRRNILEFANVPEEALLESEFPVGGFSLKVSLTEQMLGWDNLSVVLVEGSSVRSTNVVHRYWQEIIPRQKVLSYDEILAKCQRIHPLTIEDLVREMETSKWRLASYSVLTYFVGEQTPEGRAMMHLCKEMQPWDEAIRTDIVSDDMVSFRGSLEFLSWTVIVQMKNARIDYFFRKTYDILGIQSRWRETLTGGGDLLTDAPLTAAAQRKAAANELFPPPELPDGVVADLARMFRSPDEDEVWRDYCLQFLGSALERTDGVTDEDRALARETLVEALSSTNATFAGTALRSLHRADSADPLVASNALRIARDPSYPSASRTTALLILEDCVRAAPSTPSTSSTPSTLAETAAAVSADPTASTVLRQTADAIRRRLAPESQTP